MYFMAASLHFLAFNFGLVHFTFWPFILFCYEKAVLTWYTYDLPQTHSQDDVTQIAVKLLKYALAAV